MYFVPAAFNVIARETILLLLRQGHAVRAMCAKQEDADDVLRFLDDYQIDATRLQWVFGAFGDAEVFAAGLDGCDGVFLSTDAFPGFEAALVQAVDLCAASTVEHVVFVSVDQAGPEATFRLGRILGRVEARLRDSAVPWTILRPLPFLLMQNLRAQAGFVQARGAFGLPVGDQALCMLDGRDISAAAVAALGEPRNHGQTYRLTGPTRATAAELAHTLGEIVGYPVRYQPLSPLQARQQMLGLDMPEWLVDDFLGLFTGEPQGFLSRPSDDFAALTGHPPRSFDRFCTDYAWAFARGEQDGAINGWVNYQ